MTRTETIAGIKQYFKLQELVCPHTYKVFGEKGWQFLSTELLGTILALRRDILCVPLYINQAGGFTQRGLRCNLCELVKEKTMAEQIYLSAHVTGNAIDFDARGMTAEQARDRIRTQRLMLPFPVRLEKDVTWVHLDVYDYLNGQVINEF